MNTFLSYWNFNIVLMVFLIGLFALYIRMSYSKFHKQSLYFICGFLLFIVAVFSPLEFVAMHYLFSAHMISHVLLLLVVPPLMVSGIPVENRYKEPLKYFSGKMSKSPFLNWLVGIGIMWFWHIPVVYRYMMNTHEMGTSNGYFNIITITHTLSLWVAGIIFCWPLTSPYKRHRLPALKGILYLATACVSCSLLGLMLTFAPAGLYGHMSMADQYGLAKLIQHNWGITNNMDEQIAGLIMWVPCCFIYLTWALSLLSKWYSEKEVNNNSNILNPTEI